MNDIKYRDILYNDKQIGPFPSDKLKRVDTPTVNVNLGPHERKKYSDFASARVGSGAFGDEVVKRNRMYTVREPLGAAFTSVQRHINEIRMNPVAPEKAPIPEDPRVRARHIKSLGYFLGADQVGICELPQYTVYLEDAAGNPCEAPYKYAIVLMCRKNASTTRVTDGIEFVFDTCSFQAYQRLAMQCATMANYIRRLGHEADTSNMFTYKTTIMPLILYAGLGESCKTSSMLNPFLGSNMKAAAVLTNMELEIDKPIDFGLQEYCSKCKICEQVCHMNCIRGKKVEYNGYEVWDIDLESCTAARWMNVRGSSCGRCTKYCPWNFEDMDNGELAAFWSGWDGTVGDMHARVNENAKRRYQQGFVGPLEHTDKWNFELTWLDRDDRTLVIPESTYRWDYEKHPVSTALNSPDQKGIYSK